MKLSIEGRVSRQEIMDAIARTLNFLEDNGVDNFNDVNFEFTPRKGEVAVIPTLDGDEFDINLVDTFDKTKCSGF